MCGADEQVWKAEQKEKEEQKKLEEVQKQIKEERKLEEIQRIAEEAGQAPKRQEKVDFLYDAVSGNNNVYICMQREDRVLSMKRDCNCTWSRALRGG